MNDIELIIIKCRVCKKEYVVNRHNVPLNIDRLECNWCPDCEDKAEDYYEEYWIRSRRSKNSMRQRFGIQLKIGL